MAQQDGISPSGEPVSTLRDHASPPPTPRFLEFDESENGRSGTSTPQRRTNRLTYGDFGDDARYKTLITYLNNRIVAQGWFGITNTTDSVRCSGVLVRKGRGQYISIPAVPNPSLLSATQKLNVEVTFTMRTDAVDAILAALEPFQTDVLFTDGSQVQVVDSLRDILTTNVKKLQYAALIRQEKMLLVWHDDLQQILPHAARTEEKLLSLVWGSTISPFANPFDTPSHSVIGSRASSFYHLPTETPSAKKLPTITVELATEGDLKGDGEDDKAVEQPESLERPISFVSAVFVGLGMCLAVVLLFGFATGSLIIECLMDGKWIRLAFIATIPLLLLVGLFFLITIFTDLFEIFGPIDGAKNNSRSFSGQKPNLRKAYQDGFQPPHITIQMPVYKEGLETVIMPTVNSLKAAISYYESRGGTASIFINDDGIRAGISEDEARARREYYHDNNIGWVARPKHNDTDGYVRKGKFKKASNMNFALNVANKVEDYLQQMIDERLAAGLSDYLSDVELDEMYKANLDRVLREEPRVMAAGNIRMGEIILIIDSDTRVPVDCLLYGAAEMFLSPEVAIVQHSTGVMQVQHDYFENGITYFTNMVYSAINFSVSNGEVAPFVGHNAFLRWQAVQSVGKNDPDGYVAYWSESHVSEDFDLALRLQIKGNVVRCAHYHNNEFMEGVSLTIYDELARWEKYAYGCSELVFHPFKYWLFRSPLTPLFRQFLWSNLILSSKITILGYISSYFALAAGATLTLMNYLLIGWLNGSLDKFYMESWKIFVSLLVVFNILGPVSLAILRYRLGEKSLVGSLLENFKWMPMFSIFFGGLSFHLSCAILSHLCSIDMQWGATTKEAQKSNFFKELPKIFNSFKYMYAVLIIVTGGMIYLGCFAPRGWDISGYTAVVPLAVSVVSHAILPFALNPSVMIFNF